MIQTAMKESTNVLKLEHTTRRRGRRGRELKSICFFFSFFQITFKVRCERCVLDTLVYVFIIIIIEIRSCLPVFQASQMSIFNYLEGSWQIQKYFN